jgi:signal transduction histidine kinase
VGIAEDILPTIHMPFISTKENGLGLGLATAYATIEEHGGSIRCASKPGEGSVFTICLNG